MQKRGKNNPCPKSKMVEVDRFGDQFQFRLPNGKRSTKSYAGCIVTVCALFLVIFYALIQFLRLIDFQEPQIMVSERDSHFDSDYEFSIDEGL